MPRTIADAPPLVQAELLDVRVERWPLAGAFVISRGARSHIDVVVCTVGVAGFQGRGEGSPIYYRGESAQACADAIRSFADGRTFDRGSVNATMPPGAARNALDCALWDMEARLTGRPVWQLAGLQPPAPLATAITLSIDTPRNMEAAASAAVGRGFGLLKCKLGGEGTLDLERMAAVRQGAPCARLVVDANESWAAPDVAPNASALDDLFVELIEQPVPAGEDAILASIRSPVSLCADESCHDRADLDGLGMYQAINIKLDKAGGLTEALKLAEAARRRGQQIMVGCMLGTSLGIAPAFLVAQQARWVDLDGALLLASDRDGGLKAVGGAIEPGGLWGVPAIPA